MTSTDTLLGRGLYALPEAARYLRVPVSTLRRWAKGYAYSSKGEEHRGEPVLRSLLLEVDGELVLTFADLIELQFVHLFRKHNVSLPIIRAAAERAAKMFQTDHPFNVRRLQTDGKRIFAEMDPEDIQVEAISRDRIVQELHAGQIVMGPFAQMFYKDLDYDHDVASCWWPLGKKERAVLDPQRNFGKPTDNETGVPLYPLYRMVRAGESIETAAAWYDVDVGAIETALQFESNYLLKAA